MASLYKKPVKWADRKTGQRITAKSKKWWGRYRDASGVERRVPLASDKTAAQTMLNELINREERKAAGLIDQFDEHAKRPLADHVKDYRRHLESKANATSHVKLTTSYIQKVIAGCGFKVIRDLSASRVATWLSNLRTEGRSVRTSNAYLTAIKGFSRWLVRDRRAAEDVLSHLATLNAKVDVRRERRTLEPTEIAKLIDAARNGERFRTLTGADRAVLYHVALTAGLRAGELASLTPKSFDLDGDPSTITVEAAYSKHRRRDVLPLRPDVADILRKYLAACGRAGNETLWPGSWSRKGSAVMIRKDLTAAAIPYEDDAGRVFDFHALRHQFISTLARGGAASEGSAGARPAFDDHIDDGPIHASGYRGPDRRSGPAARHPNQRDGQRGGRTARNRHRRSGRAPEKGAACGAEGCRKRCQTPRIGHVEVRTKLHRRRTNDDKHTAPTKRKKPRRNRGFSRQVASVRIKRTRAEGKGFEPSTGFPAPDFESVAHAGASINQQRTSDFSTSASDAPVAREVATPGQNCPNIDADLILLIQSWPALPADTKTSILALARTRGG